MTRFPSVFGTGATQTDCHAFVLPHQRSRDPEVERATYRFIADLVKNGAAWAVAGLPLLVVFVLFQRQIVRGVAHTGLAGQ